MIATMRNTASELPAPAAEDRYWQAVRAHDPGFDGDFVYAVRSTGVYCRASCPSRRPRRDQVAFYPNAEAAEEAGFRACRRCGSRPEDASRTELLGKVLGALNDAEDGAPTLSALADDVNTSPHRLARGFKRLTGVTPREYSDARKLARLKSGLRTSSNVAEAIYEAGYGSSRAVYERARTQLGMTPGTYRRGGAGMQIGYTLVDSPLGRLLVAATDRGVCSVCIGESDAKLERALIEEYPKAEIRQDAAQLKTALEALQAHLAGRLPQLDLPIDVQATIFQWRVWRELQKIPYGETRSYREIARAIGKPKAARAVGRACATNRVAVVIPCHRAVQAGGSLGGYRWGLERKRALLARERQTNTPADAGPARGSRTASKSKK